MLGFVKLLLCNVAYWLIYVFYFDEYGVLVCCGGVRFDDASVMYHDDEVDGLISVCRLALLSSYPKYATDGFDALYSRPPVIYMSAAANQDLDRHLCLKVHFFTFWVGSSHFDVAFLSFCSYTAFLKKIGGG